MKKTIKLSSKYINRLDSYLTSHKNSVGDGKVLSEIMFCALTGVNYVSSEEQATMTCEERIRYQAAKSNKLGKVNRVLATRGLQLRSKNKYTTFTFTTDLDKTIARNETLAINAGIRNGVLMAGSKVHRGVWSKLTKSEAEHLVHGYK